VLPFKSHATTGEILIFRSWCLDSQFWHSISILKTLMILQETTWRSTPEISALWRYQMSNSLTVWPISMLMSFLITLLSLRPMFSSMLKMDALSNIRSRQNLMHLTLTWRIFMGLECLLAHKVQCRSLTDKTFTQTLNTNQMSWNGLQYLGVKLTYKARLNNNLKTSLKTNLRSYSKMWWTLQSKKIHQFLPSKFLSLGTQ